MSWRAVLLSSVVVMSWAQRAAAGDLPALLVDVGLDRAAADEVEAATLRPGQPRHPTDRCHVFALGQQVLTQGQAEVAARILAVAAELPSDPSGCVISEDTIAAWTALAEARSGRQPQAVQRLGRLEQFADDAQVRLRASHLRCVLHLYAAEPEAGATCARHWLHLQVDDRQLDDLQADPDAAAWRGGLLSALLPGLGQATAGRWDEAAAALGVNAALGYATSSLFVDGLVLDGVLLSVAMTARYYIGNIWHGAEASRNAAIQRRNRAGRALADRVLAVPAPP